MPEPRDPNQGYSIDEAVIAQMYEHEALLKLLIVKGAFTKDEYPGYLLPGDIIVSYSTESGNGFIAIPSCRNA